MTTASGASTPNSALQKIRNFAWPIFGKEHKKFIPMALMIALILFNYTIFRNIKDALVVSATGSSEIITFLKVWVVLPMAFLFFMLFAKLSNIFTKQQIFYGVVTAFLAFFALFSFVLYPHQEFFTPVASVTWLQDNLPASLNNFINMYKYWSFSLFYAMAELWGSVIASLLFWQFANSIVQVSEAKRFYSHFYLLANLATAFSGIVSNYISGLGTEIVDPAVRYGNSLNYLVLITIGAGIGAMGLYHYVNNVISSDPSLMPSKDNVIKKKKKPKLSLGESIKFIFQSKYLAMIAVLVISYGITINLVEVSWKHQLHLAFPQKNEYNAYMGMVSFYSGIATFVVILCGSSLVRLLGWLFGAIATPIAIGVTGTIFFYFMIFDGALTPLATALGTTSITLIVLIGAGQNILSKSIKYALFDPTKEMSYIPLDDESKAKGKAAVDVVGARFGKAGGALMQQGMFIFIGPIAMIAPYSAAIMLGFVGVWVFAVFALNKMFQAKCKENEALEQSK